jgi:pimeloyl-ACP methyl ester carboxylesterase
VREFAFERGGVKLVGGSGGRPELPTVLFINAVGMRASLLDGLADGYRAAGFNLLTWELRGSPGERDARGLALDDHVADGLAVLDALGLPAAHIAGWCTGASVAAALVRTAPARALSLTSVDGAFLFEGSPAAPLGNAVYEMCAEIEADEARGAFYHEVTKPRGNGAAVLGIADDPELVDHLSLPYRQGVEGLVRYAFALRSVVRDYDARTVLSGLRLPALFAARRDDRLVTFRDSERAAALIPGARLELADSGGHYALFQRPDAAVPLAAFLRGISETSSLPSLQTSSPRKV